MTGSFVSAARTFWSASSASLADSGVRSSGWSNSSRPTRRNHTVRSRLRQVLSAIVISHGRRGRPGSYRRAASIARHRVSWAASSASTGLDIMRRQTV